MSIEFSWINQYLAQGSYPGPPESAWKYADVLVLCAEEHQPRVKVPKGKKVLRFPIDDDIYRPIPPPVAEYAHQLAAELAKYIRAGKKVLVTCAQGVNRSGLISALTLMHAYGMTGRRAIDLLRSKRKPHGGLYVLCNPIFEAYVISTRPTHSTLQGKAAWAGQ